MGILLFYFCAPGDYLAFEQQIHDRVNTIIITSVFVSLCGTTKTN